MAQPKKNKVKGLRYWTRKLDTVFSQYIRLKYADKDGMVSCITCGVRRHYKDSMHAGHFHDRKWMGVRWDENNVRPQCAYCNTYRAGRGPDFYRVLFAVLGNTVLDDLFVKRQRNWLPYELEEMYNDYRRKLKDLMRIRGIK